MEVAPLDFGRDHSGCVDVFSKSEKWIGTPNFESWSTAGLSLEFEQSARWPTASCGKCLKLGELVR